MIGYEYSWHNWEFVFTQRWAYYYHVVPDRDSAKVTSTIRYAISVKDLICMSSTRFTQLFSNYFNETLC